jgi:hypothetical protein
MSQLLATGYWLLATVYCLLATGDWLLPKDQLNRGHQIRHPSPKELYRPGNSLALSLQSAHLWFLQCRSNL